MADKTGKPEKINIDHILKESEGRDPSSEEEGLIEVVSSDEPDEADDVADEDEDAGEIEDSGESYAGLEGEDPGAAALEETLGEALREKEELHDRYMRAVADLENFRKRVARDREEERARVSMSLLGEILPALDNLQRAVDEPAEGDALKEGIALIKKQFDDALRKLGVEEIDALGEPFDPVYHEALSVEARPGFAPNTVVEEIRKGFTLGGRVVRPSLVKVAVAPEMSAQGAGETGDADGAGHRD